MKNPLVWFVCLWMALPYRLGAEDGFVDLFNGKDLSGWEGNPQFWTVENGILTGRTQSPDDLAYNQFLIWRGGLLKNFELRAQVRVQGENNSGIQYRSQELPEVGPWSVGGYQCDIHPAAEYNGMLYHERGRGIVAKNGQSVVADPQARKWLVAERNPVAVAVSEWQEYHIIAQGNHLVHKINGQVTAELHDYDEANRSLEGLLAFQIHRGPAMKVEIRDVKLKTLPDSAPSPFSKADLPNDAQEIPGPAPASKAPAKPAPTQPSPAAAPTASEANQATPVSRIKALEGFAVDLLYSVPGEIQGSWVALCLDDKERLYVSDQYGGLYRFPVPGPGETLDPARIEAVPAEIRAVNGMHFAEGALYVGVNDYEKKIPSGLYKLTDSDGDDRLDRVELLRAMDASGDHGVHAVVPVPGSEDFYLICGNNTAPAEATPDSPAPALWGEDHLLPRLPDGRGHNRHVLAPGGIVYRVSRDGQRYQRIATGFRNIYDASVNQAGELFTYDADMEYDFNTPWYRPTRVNHVVSGGEFGWRNGAGKYPDFYADTLPTTLDIGPGSPTGTLFGYGAKFPAKYQKALYLLDWSWGKIYAVHLSPLGASYTGSKEEFLSGSPLPVTDAVIHPKDGAMYFAIGGRRVQSGLYRVRYVGSEDTSPAPAETSLTEEAKLRHSLEAWHGKADPRALEAAWPHLAHADRHIRWAARVVLEHQALDTWRERAFTEGDPAKRITALLAMARLGGVCPYHRVPPKPLGMPPGEPAIAPPALPEGAVATPPVDLELRTRLIDSLTSIDFAALAPEWQAALVRTLQIVLNRFDGAGEQAETLVRYLDPHFPAESFPLNWLLGETLAYLQAPQTAAKGIALLREAISQEEQLEYARSLRFLTTGWTLELRQAYLEWFLKAANYRGGASFEKFIEFIRNDALGTFTGAEKAALAELIDRKPERVSAIENLGAIFAGRTPTMWTLEELSEAAQTGMTNRDFENGRRMFAAAACLACHRFRDGGGMNGPDLTGAGGRYSPHDFLDQIINPSKEINEQFAPVVVTKQDGSSVSGIVVNLHGDTIVLNTDLTDPNQRVNVDRKEVKNMEVSKVSPMPPMLLSLLNKEEILDLVAYVLSGGDPAHEMFRK